MNPSNQKTYTFHISGMHCQACVLMTESELGDLPSVTHVKSSLKNHSVEVTGDFGDKTPEQIAEELTAPLKPHGYIVSVEKQIKQKTGPTLKSLFPSPWPLWFCLSSCKKSVWLTWPATVVFHMGQHL